MCPDSKAGLLHYVAGALAVLLLVCPTLTIAQEPILELRKLLVARPTVEPGDSEAKQAAERGQFHAEREKQLGKIIDEKLATFSDLLDALLLNEWGDLAKTERDDSDIVATDARMRFRVAERFRAGVRGIVERGDNDGEAAIASFIAELGRTVRAALDPTVQLPSDELERLRRAGFARSLTDDIVRLMAVDSELVRLHAVRALGAIHPDPHRAAPLLGAKLSADNGVKVRRVAAESMLRLVADGAYLKEQTFKSTPVWANDLDVLTVAAEVVPTAAIGLGDADMAVRLSCAEALRTSARALAVNVQRKPGGAGNPAARVRPRGPGEIAALKALLQAFAVAGPRIAVCLGDPSVEVRHALVRTLERLGDARYRLAEEPLDVGHGAERVLMVPPQAHDPLANFAKGDWRGVARLLHDPDVHVRRGAVNFLEFFADARPAVVPELGKSLADPDRFVRWGAARALGNFSKSYQPRDAVPAVAALAKLLFDQDVAVRLAAAATLESLGKHAEAAVPDIARAIHFGDVENRVAVLRAAASVGADHVPAALASVTSALAHPDARVRRAAVVALGKLGPLADNATTVAALRRALSDSDQAVRVQASEAVRLIVNPGPR
jgi:HEAT repeat protein